MCKYAKKMTFFHTISYLYVLVSGGGTVGDTESKVVEFGGIFGLHPEVLIAIERLVVI
jgi:hypothetical protein